MKQKFLQRFIVILILLVMAVFNVDAYVYNSRADKTLQGNVKANHITKKGLKPIKSLPNGGKVFIDPNEKKPVLSRAEELVQLTIEYKFDSEYFFHWSTIIFNDLVGYNDYEFEYDYDNNLLIANVVPGTYDIVTHFGYCFYDDLSEAEIPTGSRLVVKENIEVKSDMTIQMDVSECTNRIHCDTYTPNGELLELPTLNDEGWDTENSNAIDLIANSYVYIGNQLVIVLMTENGVQNYEPMNACDFYINDCSERLYIRQVRTILAFEPEYYFSSFAVNGSKSAMFETLPNEYKSIQTSFITSPQGETSPLGHYLGFESIEMFDYVQECNVSSDNGEKVGNLRDVTMYIAVDKEQIDDDPHHFGLLVMPTYTDYSYEETTIYDWGEGDIEEITEQRDLKTIGLPMLINGNNIEYVNKGHDAYGNFAFQIPEYPETTIYEYPGHPIFSYMENQNKMEYGYSAPVASFMAQNCYNKYYETNTSFFMMCYIGQSGEIRMADYADLDMDFKFNGVQRATKYAQADSVCYVMAEKKENAGLYDITFENKNVLVDGVQGYNKTHIVYDGKKEDWTAPTLQMLQLRNNVGDITNQFEKGEDGVLEFAGGDFNYVLSFDPPYDYFDCKEQDVKVEYSPYGEDAWKSLPVEELEEYYTRPAFGYFYRGKLDVVKELSENGWFDLRIKLTDLSDNYQEQVISPAFKINSMSGIQFTENNNREIVASKYFTIDGRIASKDTKGLVIRSDQYSNGMWKNKIVTQ